MRRLFVGNFDFEHELADPRGWRASTDVSRMLAERASSWISIANDGDWIWTPEPIDECFWDQVAQSGLPRVSGVTDWESARQRNCELVPWGWSDRMTRQADQQLVPEIAAVRTGNSRRWSAQLEREMRVALPGAATVDRIEDLAGIVGRAASELGWKVESLAWVVKANFGMAARERLLGRGPTLSVSHANWMNRRIKTDGAVYFEPWLAIRAEIGIQWHVPRIGCGEPELIGLSPLLTDARGEFRGSGISLECSVPAEWQTAVERTEFVAARLQHMGYCGPLGIDAALADDGSGRPIERPIQDINARFTMGRLALGFRRFLQPGSLAEWRHFAGVTIGHADEDGSRRISTSPPVVGSQAVRHRSELVIRPVT